MNQILLMGILLESGIKPTRETVTHNGTEYHFGSLYYTCGMVETSRTSSARAAAPASLRERTRAAMRAEVSEVAFRLFAEQGFGKTTVEQIAAEAGLSRTTFFRYFGTKEELVLGKMNEFGHEVAAALAARPEGERPWEALRRAFDVITEPRAAEPEPSLRLMQLLSDACALMTRQWEKTQGWQSMLAPEITHAARLRLGIHRRSPRPGPRRVSHRMSGRRHRRLDGRRRDDSALRPPGPGDGRAERTQRIANGRCHPCRSARPSLRAVTAHVIMLIF